MERLAVNKDSGKIVENKSEPISIDTNNSGVQTPAAGNINIGKQKEEPIKEVDLKTLTII